MDANDLKAKFASISIRSVVKTSEAREKQRLISDVEFLNQEQYEFLESHTQQKFYGFMEQYWADKMITAGITCKTFKGEVINVDPKSIKVIDKRWKGASHCLCGKAIRYEYWIQHYGPIGSVHICEHTNLDQQLVRDLTKGYTKQNELRTDIVKMLADLKAADKTYEDWAASFNLSKKLEHLNNVKNPERRQLIAKLCELKLPLPEDLRRELSHAEYLATRPVAPAMSAPLMQMVPAVSPTPTAPVEHPHKGLLEEIQSTLLAYKMKPQGVSGYQINTLESLQKTIERGTPSTAQIAYAKTLVSLVHNAGKAPRPSGWEVAQSTARQVLACICNGGVADDFVQSLYRISQKGELTVKQLDCIFAGKSVRGHIGLYQKFHSIMSANQIVNINPQSYK